MLNLPVYLYTPAIRVFLDLENSTNYGVDNMYHGYATVAKGIKNKLRFNFLNGDQRSININGMNFRFNVFDYSTNKQVLSKSVDVLDDTTTLTVSADQTDVGKVLTFTSTAGIETGMIVSGVGIQQNCTVASTTATTITLSLSTKFAVTSGTDIRFVTKNLKGMAEVTLLGNDTVLLNSGKYTYSILRDEIDINELSPVFIDGASNISGLLSLVDSISPKFRESDTLKFNRQNDTSIYSTGRVPANNDGKGSPSLHTAAFYLNGFEGDLKIYGSIENSIGGEEKMWVLLNTITYNGTTGVDYANLEGVFNFFKFDYTKVSGSIDKVLYRS